MWDYCGQQRPDFAIEPGPGEESVWDYPRPPVAEACSRSVEVKDGKTVVARSVASYRIKETASPPTFYLPADDVNTELLVGISGSSVCEWKGAASYFALARAPGVPVAWAYPRPRARFERIRDYYAFYPGRIACFVDGDRVKPQPGRFYGGWITREVVGPFKGEPGTGHW